MTTLIVIVREDGKYLAAQPDLHSYTRKLEKAKRFTSREQAERCCCDNERVVER